MYRCVIRNIAKGDLLRVYIADQMTTELVFNAIMAILSCHELDKMCIFHSDRGKRYTSKAMMDSYGSNGCDGVFHESDAGRQCMVEKLLCDYEKGAYTLDAQ